MLTRRTLIATSAVLVMYGALTSVAPQAFAQASDPAASFVDETAKQLAQVVNGPGPLATKQQALQQIVDRVVDVSEIGRFCLGRFWRTATPAQQQEYLALFHRVLMINITGKIGDYEGVTFSLGRSAPRDGDVAVSTTVTRPGNAPVRVDWLVSAQSGSQKIVDVIAEGTSLRLTQRSDYASYLSHNDNNVQRLIEALRQQAAQKQG